MRVPNVYPLKKLINILKNHGIYLDVSRGKGGHGSFRGNDINGNYQLYPLPAAQMKKEVTGNYIRGLLRRFGLDESIFDE
jgi:hypothetical protein